MSAPPLVWVVGAGGLLGGAVLRALLEDAWQPRAGLSWGTTQLEQEFRDAVAAFGERMAAQPGRPWAVAWCAGAGVVGTSAAALEAETKAFQLFLSVLASDPTLRVTPGSIALASSAGGVHGGCFSSPITEATAPEPISPYGHAKLAQERLLIEWAAGQADVRVLAARFSNLYGPGQRLEKPQGLISHASRCLIFGAPIHIYVSLDTIRDYLFGEDAGQRLVNGLGRLRAEGQRQPTVTKLYTAEREVSIAGLLGVFRHITRRRLRVIAGLHPVAALQPRRLQFRSQVWGADPHRHVELTEGISRVYRHQLSLFRAGTLPAPPSLARR